MPTTSSRDGILIFPSYFFFFVPTSTFLFSFCASRVRKDFPVLSLWSLRGAKGMTVKVFFWFPEVVSLASLTSSPCTTAFGY